MEWIEADRFERYVLAEEVCTPGSPAYQSATVYDRRSVNLSAENITKWDASTQAWMKAWFDANAEEVAKTGGEDHALKGLNLVSIPFIGASPC